MGNKDVLLLALAATIVLINAAAIDMVTFEN